jgi:di/tricarboxylate transporter
MEIALVLGLLVIAIVLFSTERIGVDVVTGLLLVVLVLTGILSPTEKLSLRSARNSSSCWPPSM